MCTIRTLLENRRFFVELEGKRSRWRSQRNGLLQGSVIAPLLFKVYTCKRPTYSPGHAQLCVCRRYCRHYTEHRLCTYRGNTALNSSWNVGVVSTIYTVPQTSSALIRQRSTSALSIGGIANVANSSTSAGTV